MIIRFILFIFATGSSKLNRNCISQVKVSESPTGTIVAEICHTHYPHEVELQHVRLTMQQRQTIAGKLSQVLGVLGDTIIDKIFEQVSTCLDIMNKGYFLLFLFIHGSIAFISLARGSNS